MRRREASINDLLILETDRKFFWPLSLRPADHPASPDAFRALESRKELKPPRPQGPRGIGPTPTGVWQVLGKRTSHSRARSFVMGTCHDHGHRTPPEAGEFAKATANPRFFRNTSVPEKGRETVDEVQAGPLTKLPVDLEGSRSRAGRAGRSRSRSSGRKTSRDSFPSSSVFTGPAGSSAISTPTTGSSESWWSVPRGRGGGAP